MLFVVMYRNWLWLKLLSTAHLSNFSYKSFKFDVVITWQRGNLQTSGGTYELPLLSSTSVQPFGRQSSAHVINVVNSHTFSNFCDFQSAIVFVCLKLGD